MLSSAYLKIATTPNILDCLRLLQGFIVEALLVETKVEYESLVRFCNALRIRDITFSETCAKLINVTDSDLAGAGVLHHALSVFDVFLSEAIEICARYGIGSRPFLLMRRLIPLCLTALSIALPELTMRPMTMLPLPKTATSTLMRNSNVRYWAATNSKKTHRFLAE